jgi:hypothetical protein
MGSFFMQAAPYLFELVVRSPYEKNQLLQSDSSVHRFAGAVVAGASIARVRGKS